MDKFWKLTKFQVHWPFTHPPQPCIFWNHVPIWCIWAYSFLLLSCIFVAVPLRCFSKFVYIKVQQVSRKSKTVSSSSSVTIFFRENNINWLSKFVYIKSENLKTVSGSNRVIIFFREKNINWFFNGFFQKKF